MFVLSC